MKTKVNVATPDKARNISGRLSHNIKFHTSRKLAFTLMLASSVGLNLFGFATLFMISSPYISMGIMAVSVLAAIPSFLGLRKHSKSLEQVLTLKDFFADLGATKQEVLRVRIPYINGNESIQMFQGQNFYKVYGRGLHNKRIPLLITDTLLEKYANKVVDCFSTPKLHIVKEIEEVSQEVIYE